jgi:hypothetical protein
MPAGFTYNRGLTSINGVEIVEVKFEEVRRLLPQKFPFLMVDKVIELEKGKRTVGVKNISGNEIHFLGHFPHMAVFPGALILEGIAQTAILSFGGSIFDMRVVVFQDRNLVLLRYVVKDFLGLFPPGKWCQATISPFSSPGSDAGKAAGNWGKSSLTPISPITIVTCRRADTMKRRNTMPRASKSWRLAATQGNCGTCN